MNAETLFLTNGRSLPIVSHEYVGELVTVRFPDGGEATFDRALVLHIQPGPASEAGAETARVERPEVPLEGRPFADLIEAVSAKHGVDPKLVHAVVETESNYRPRARSHAGARGLMQVMPATGAQYGVHNLYDPASNLEAGVRHLKNLLGRFDLTTAIAAYNAGEGSVQRYGGIPPYRETQNYVKKVLARFDR